MGLSHLGKCDGPYLNIAAVNIIYDSVRTFLIPIDL